MTPEEQEMEMEAEAAQARLRTQETSAEPQGFGSRLMGGISALREQQTAVRDFGLNLALGAGLKGIGEILDLPITLSKLTGLATEEEMPGFYAPAAEAVSRQLLQERYDPGVQELGSYLTPVGPEKLGLQLASGLGAYTGTKGAESLFPESTGAQIVGGLLGSFTPTGLRAGSALTRKVASLPDALNIEKQAQREVAAQLSPEELRTLAAAQETGAITSTVPYPKTLAEVIGSPEIAMYQDISRSTPEGAPILQAEKARAEALQAARAEIATEPPVGALRDEVEALATQQKEQVAAIEGRIVDELGGVGEATPREAGELIQTGLAERKQAKKQVVDAKWDQVPKNLEIDLTDEIDPIFAWWDSLNDIRKKRAGRVGTSIRELRQQAIDPENPQYLMTYDTFQAIREGVNDIIASRKEKPSTQRYAKILKNKMDEAIGSIDPKAEELVDIGFSDKDVTALYDAIKESRDYYKTYTEGAVGLITKERLGELQTKASGIIKLATKNPENVSEIIGKFGRNADEAVVLRQELMKELQSAADPVKQLNKRVDVYKAAFDADFDTIKTYAEMKKRGVPLDKYMSAQLSDASIANRIFRSPETVAKFLDDFDGTPVVTMARGKLLSQIERTRGDMTKKLALYENVGKELFREDWDLTKQVLQEIESGKTPSRQLSRKAGFQSATQPREAVAEQISEGRTAYRWADKAPTLAAVVGAFLTPGKRYLGFLGGKQVGEFVKGKVAKREQRFKAAIASLLADPRLIKISKKEATPENIKILDDYIEQFVIGAKAGAITISGEE